jgi:hypothetical protein
MCYVVQTVCLCYHYLIMLSNMLCCCVLQAFVKIREQARAYLDKPAELSAGLNLVLTTNLDYFQVACV